METNNIRVCIVEDDAKLRQSLVQLIAGSPGFLCVGDFDTGEEACASIPTLAPHVVLMDIHLPGMSGIDAVARLKAAAPDLQMMMLTVYEESDLIFKALAAGAMGYLVKRTPPARLLEAIQELHRGESPMSGHIARKIIQSLHAGGDCRPSTPPPLPGLTPAERKVLAHLAQGCLYKEIADTLQISIHTVRTHIRAIYEKLQVHSRTEAVIRFYGK